MGLGKIRQLDRIRKMMGMGKFSYELLLIVVILSMIMVWIFLKIY